MGRTDRTFICVSCLSRGTQPVCSHCRRPASDGHRADTLRRLDARLRSRRLGGPDGKSDRLLWYEQNRGRILGVVSFVASAIIIATTLSGPVTLGWSYLPFFTAPIWLVLMLASAVVQTLLEVRIEDKTDAERHPMLLVASDPIVDPTLARETIDGTVRLSSPVTSPLGHGCAAFRVTGVGPSGAIDDGGAGRFEVETAGGERILVEAGKCTVELTCGEPRPIEVSPGVAHFLDPRGVRSRSGQVRLAESLLGDGDPVRVEGTISDEPVALGYREAGTRRVLRELHGSPLVLRRPA